MLDSSMALAPDGDGVSCRWFDRRGWAAGGRRADPWIATTTGASVRWEEIYSLRASGFQNDVNLIVEDSYGHWLAQSWNWGELLDDGSFRPSMKPWCWICAAMNSARSSSAHGAAQFWETPPPVTACV